ncbi:flagellar basal body P-ring formation chaperone FlgA [Henriciella aquimarina]|uniref:flagellar basal body P-ring formation chaperone FlgA n=1 Tax=Henriciella aquimarina TaxID=545261 RepID=UPI000A019ABE|nr:flagellar basal body P-ring formation chaperone FlgA [Henriciella aquimarina]
MAVLTALGASLAVYLSGSASFVATDVIRAGDRITSASISTEAGEAPPSDTPLIGREVRRTVYAGQEVSMQNTQPARVIERNQVVTLKYIRGGLEITTSGRAMAEAAVNETVAVMNLQSRQMVHGIVQKDGWVLAQ